MDENKEYYAFISYKREDKKEAKRLQHALEYYRLPNHLRQENPELPEYVRPVFRDMTNLEVGELSAQIHTGLEQSHFLIVVCSPRAANSKWVNDEVEYFISLGKQDKIIPYIIEGIPYASNPSEECYPPALLHLSKEKELLGANINDVGKDSATIRVVSRMFNIRFDTLFQRYQREQKKRHRQFTAAITLAFLFLSGIAGWIWHQNVLLKEREWKMMESQARAVAEKAQTLVAQRNSVLAVKALLNVLPDSKTSSDRPYVPEAERALRDAYNSLTQNSYHLIYSNTSHNSSISELKFSPDGKYYATKDLEYGYIHNIRIWDANSYKQLSHIKERESTAIFSLKGDTIFVTKSYQNGKSRFVMQNWRNGREYKSWEIEGLIDDINCVPNKNEILISCAYKTIVLNYIDDSIKEFKNEKYYNFSLFFDMGSQLLLVSYNNKEMKSYFKIVDTNNWQITNSFSDSICFLRAVVKKEGTIITQTKEDIRFYNKRGEISANVINNNGTIFDDMALSEDEQSLIVVPHDDNNKYIVEYDLKTMKQTYKLPLSKSASVHVGYINNDRNIIITSQREPNGLIQILNRGKIMDEHSVSSLSFQIPHLSDGSSRMSTTYNKKYNKILITTAGNKLIEIMIDKRTCKAFPLPFRPRTACYTPKEDKILITRVNDGRIYELSLLDGKIYACFDADTVLRVRTGSTLSAITFTPDNRYIVVAHNKELLFINALTYKLRHTIQSVEDNAVWNILFCDNKIITENGVWNYHSDWTCNNHYTLENCLEATDICIIDNKETLLGYYGHFIKMWDLKGNVLKEFNGLPSSISSARFGRDKKTLLIASSDSTIRILDINSEVELACFKAHNYVYDAIQLYNDYILANSSSLEFFYYQNYEALIKQCKRLIDNNWSLSNDEKRQLNL